MCETEKLSWRWNLVCPTDKERIAPCSTKIRHDAAKAAATRDVEVTPLSRYNRRRMAQKGLQLGFAVVDAAEIRRGVRELAVALEEENKKLLQSLTRCTKIGTLPK